MLVIESHNSETISSLLFTDDCIHQTRFVKPYGTINSYSTWMDNVLCIIERKLIHKNILREIKKAAKLVKNGVEKYLPIRSYSRFPFEISCSDWYCDLILCEKSVGI